MRLINLTCPNCNAQLQIDADRKQVYCKYCGTALLVDDQVQHIQYDNAEEAGYNFERGRQRAIAEANMITVQPQQYVQPQAPQYNQQYHPPKKSNNMIWWFFGWMLIFPVPITILLLRKKDMDKRIKYGLIALAWLVYILVFGSGGNKNNQSQIQEPAIESIQESTPETIARLELTGQNGIVKEVVL